MSARRKLNIAFLNGSLVLAIVAGVVTESWLVFGLTLVVLVVVNLHTGQIRPTKTKR